MIKSVEKLKIHWVTPNIDAAANALGYATHNNYMRKASEPYLDFDDSAKIALHIVSADHYRPIMGKKNILFTMWEFTDLPPSYIRSIKFADAIIVPSSFCQQLFQKYTKKKVYVCFEGVDEEIYKYHQRTFPKYGQKFRFLWVGAPNVRKGYPIILEAIKIFEAFENIEIYLKTTVPQINFWTMFKNIIKHLPEILYDKERKKLYAFGRMLKRLPRPSLAGKIKILGKYKNVIIDTRKLSIAELVDLYNSAHCFVLPSFGEGWGLTLIEAMATGCPCIAPMHTGMADFFNHKFGYVMKSNLMDFDLPDYDLVTSGYIPDTFDCIDKMVCVIKSYPEALRKAKKASENVRNLFTWKRAGRRLYEILKEIEKKGK